MKISSEPRALVRTRYVCAAQRTFTVVQRYTLGAFVCFVLAPAAHAEPSRDALFEMTQCTKVGDPAERLHCFDAAAARAQQSPAPSAESFGKPPPPAAELDKITAPVRELSRTPRGQAIFVLDNGQTWRQLDADDVRVMDPAPGRGMRVTIERGAFGSYNLVIEGRNGVIKVRRVQ